MRHCLACRFGLLAGMHRYSVFFFLMVRGPFAFSPRWHPSLCLSLLYTRRIGGKVIKMSIDARHMALLNEYLMSDSDYGNVTNGDNSRIFNKILDGDYASSMFDYLTNCGSLKLNDIISM
jgi:hypothetical protein